MSDLLDLVLAAHGGLERWREVRYLDVRLSASGGLFQIKGHPEGLHDVIMRIETQRPAVTFVPFGRPDYRGHFTPTRVWIEDREGRVVEEHVDPRASFAGHALATPWDRLQLLYFTGYANWNYFTAPFLLTQSGVDVREMGPHEEYGETWQRLQVQFPSTIPTHSAEQTFYLNEKGLLQQLDYVAEIAGAAGAHYCFDHTSFSGLVFPTLRRVVGLTPTGPLISGPTVVLLLISDIVVLTNL
ncbi:MAG: hypothetical protein WBL67_19825 [Nitrososphaeraceae archaeon]